MTAEKITEIVLEVLSKHKAFDVVTVDVREKSSVTDYFIIASARSSTQVKSLAEYCEEGAEKQGVTVLRKEGIADGRWAVIDFGDVILHIFNDETRLFYHLERLWDDGDKIKKIEDDFQNKTQSVED